MIQKLMNIDKRYIYLLIALAVIIPTIFKFQLSISASGPTRKVYDFIELLPPNSKVILAFDFGPGSMAELKPMAHAILRHCYSRKIKVLGIALWPDGALLGNTAMNQIAAEFKAKDGEDYVFLGFRPGPVNVILQMGEDIRKIFNTDFRGRRVDELPVMNGVKNYRDIALVVDFGAGSSPNWWITFANAKYQAKVAAGVTGIIISQLYPYTQSGQLIGMIPGMMGAAEYERLINKPDKASLGMPIQSSIHLLIIAFVIIGNIAYFTTRRREKT